MTKESRSDNRSWLPALWAAIAVAVGVVAFWAFGLTVVDAPPSGADSQASDSVSERTAAAAEQPAPAPQKAETNGSKTSEGGDTPLNLKPRIFSDYGFTVDLDPAWVVETGASGVRVKLPEERFFLLRTPAPTQRGSIADAPGNQEIVTATRIAGSDVLCTVDPGTSERVRNIVVQVCKTAKDHGGLGVLTGFKCEADADIDLDTTVVEVEAVREEIITCFTGAHRNEVEMAVGQASVAVEPSPEGVPLTILVGGDVPTQVGFNWLTGCLTDLFRHIKYTKQGDGDGMLRCEFNWSIE